MARTIAHPKLKTPLRQKTIERIERAVSKRQGWTACHILDDAFAEAPHGTTELNDEHIHRYLDGLNYR